MRRSTSSVEVQSIFDTGEGGVVARSGETGGILGQKLGLERYKAFIIVDLRNKLLYIYVVSWVCLRLAFYPFKGGMFMMMNMVEASEKVNNIVEDLFISVRKEQVEGVFSKNRVDDKPTRIQLLRKCMNVIDMSNTGETLSEDDEYDDELEIFLNGKWRMLI